MGKNVHSEASHLYCQYHLTPRDSLSFLSGQEIKYLVQVLLLVSGDGDIAGGVCYAGQDEAVLNLAVVQE